MCHRCREILDLADYIGRRDLCPFCGADLHVCLNCRFYEPGAYNECREPQAERVLDKERSTFCDFFDFGDKGGPFGPAPKRSFAKDRLDAIFLKERHSE